MAVDLTATGVRGGNRQSVTLVDLQLDGDNPRFGNGASGTEQADILDYIVSKFGVIDVISSLAVNGYFEAEPLVCRVLPDKRYEVAEGNRRLAACLILAGDPRAARQASLGAQYRVIWEQHGKPAINPLPCIVFSGEGTEKDLLSYLGVRHIASAKAWDSFAKAAWVARVVSEVKLPVRDVSMMIGDQYETISRMLQGYHVVQQLQNAGLFNPEDSQRKGRGSVTAYPFSWVYTLLSYSGPRQYLGISDDPANPEPIPKENLRRGGVIMRAMFGDKSTSKSGAIGDSRELGRLASVFADAEKVSMIEEGKTVAEIEKLTQPVADLLRQSLAAVRGLQADMVSRIAETPPSIDEAAQLVSMATKNRSVATQIETQLRNAGSADGG
jgi:hypothetical protein